MTNQSPAAGDYHPWTTYIFAREEARRRGDRKVGTEHLILGLTCEPVLARALGCDLQTARDALQALDRGALAAVVGVALDAPPVPSHAPADLPPRPTLRTVLLHRLPLTPAAKQALRASGRDIRRGRHIESRDVLLTLLELQRPDPAAELLCALGVDRDAVRKSLVGPAPSQ